MHLKAEKPAKIPETVAWKSLKQLIERFHFKPQEALILMGDMPRSTFYKGMSQHLGFLSRDQLDRISYLLGMYKALRILFDNQEQAMTWINRENTLPPFNGMTPKEYMLEGSIVRLAEVRQFLDFWRGY